MESRPTTWTVKHESSPTTWIVNYESKTHTIDSKVSGSFSLRIRGIDRTLIRSPSGRESLVKQRTIGGEKDAEVAIVSEIPPDFLDGEEICNRYVANVLSKANINIWMQQRVVPNISKDAINMNRLHGEEKGFMVEAEAEIVKETSLDNWLCVDDYDSEGRRKIPIEQDCVICLEELSSGGQKKKIMKLPCSHNFHRDCVLSWLRRKHSCPSCRDDINNPRPKKNISSRILM